MAITSSSQILSVNKVSNATKYLGYAINYLETAKRSIENAIKYSDESVFQTNEGNTFPKNARAVIDSLTNRIAELEQLKDLVLESAIDINASETAQYNEYIEKKSAEEEANKDAKETVRV